MNIVCAKCGAGVAFELPSLANQTVVSCSACHSGLKVTIEVFELPVNAPAPQPAVAAGGRPRAVVAIQGEATRELIRDLLVAEGFEVIERSSGAEALADLKEARPALVLVDVGLADVPGFRVCETVRADPANVSVKMILVAAIHNKDRYRRPPDNLFGADDFIERHQIETQLVDKVKQLFGEARSDGGVISPSPSPSPSVTDPGPVRPTAVPDERVLPAPALQERVVAVPSLQDAGPPAAPLVRPAPTPTAPQVAEAPAPVVPTAEKDGAAAGVTAAPSNPAEEAALRLARIIVSDIALYNAKKVDEGILNGTFFDLLRTEIEEGRKLYEDRKGAGLTTTLDLFRRTLDQFVATRRELLKRNRPAA